MKFEWALEQLRAGRAVMLDGREIHPNSEVTINDTLCDDWRPMPRRMTFDEALAEVRNGAVAKRADHCGGGFGPWDLAATDYIVTFPPGQEPPKVEPVL